MLSICRPVCRPVTSALTESRPASVSGVTWDPAHLTGGVVLSNGNLSASLSVDTGGEARSTSAKSSGKWAVRVLTSYGGAPGDAEVILGFGEISLQFGNSGTLVVADTALVLLIDIDAGKAWFGNDAGVSGDPEAGTGEGATFASLAPYFFVQLYSLDNLTPAIATIDPAYSSGTFAAWSP